MKPVLTIMFLLTFYLGYTCSCINLGKIDKEQFESYDLIITGKILNIDFGEFTQKIKIGIHKIYKGKVSNLTITLSSSSQSGMCGIFPKVGEKWLVYANGKKTKFSTSLCTRTQNLTRISNREETTIKEDLIFLKKNTTRNKNYCQQYL